MCRAEPFAASGPPVSRWSSAYRMSCSLAMIARRTSTGSPLSVRTASSASLIAAWIVALVSSSRPASPVTIDAVMAWAIAHVRPGDTGTVDEDHLEG
jgi:hypothetical protein